MYFNEYAYNGYLKYYVSNSSTGGVQPSHGITKDSELKVNITDDADLKIQRDIISD